MWLLPRKAYRVRNMKQYLPRVIFNAHTGDQQSLHRTKSIFVYAHRRLVNSAFSRTHRDDFAAEQPLACGDLGNNGMRACEGAAILSSGVYDARYSPSAASLFYTTFLGTEFPRDTRTGWIWRRTTCAGPVCWWSIVRHRQTVKKNDITHRRKRTITPHLTVS